MNDIEKIKLKIDVADLLAEYIQLKKAGRSFKANCPFHNEKTPSFIVSPERQIWHCFGCGKGGDIFTFLMEFEHIEFGEALTFLAQKTGVPLATRPAQSIAEQKREKLYTINNAAAQYYSYLLLEHPSGKKALSYLTDKRLLPIELIKKFGLGFAPHTKDGLISYLIKKKNISEEDLVLSGLASLKGKQLYDFFWSRIIFPLLDSRGNIIAFSGRVLDDTYSPKYINNKETAVYRKGNTVYGLYQAKEEIKKQKSVIIVEGEFDVISSFKEGVRNIVAIKGTALTENQIKLLKRFSEKIIFCFDQDAAGIEAQRRSIELIEKEGIAASAIIPPKGKDLDGLVRADPILFHKVIKHDTSIYDFVIESALAQFDPRTADGKKQILNKTIPYINLIENAVIQEHYQKLLSRHLDTSLESIQRQSQKRSQGTNQQIDNPEQQKETIEEKKEHYLLALILQSKNPIESLQQASYIIGTVPMVIPSYEKLFRLMLENQNILAESLNTFAKLLPSELLPTFDNTSITPIPIFTENKLYEREIRQTSLQVKDTAIKVRLKTISASLKQAEKENASEDDKQKLLEEMVRLTSLLKTPN